MAMGNNKKIYQINVKYPIFCAVAISFISFGCGTQVNQDKSEPENGSLATLKDTLMETFNILIFKEKKVDGEYFFTLDDGTEVMQLEWPPEYYEEKIKKPKSPFQLYKQYYFFSGKIKLSGTFFYNSPYGIWKEYDEKGNTINIKDYEKNFEFSIDKLDYLMHKMDVDILSDQPGVYVNRSISGKSVYVVEYPINSENPYSLNKIIIDGNTGEIIKKTIIEKE